MAQRIPSFYFGDRFSEFERAFAAAEGAHPCRFAKGDLLTCPSDINNTAFYVREGIMQFSLQRPDGHEQAVALFGPGQVFPIGVTHHDHRMDFDMVMLAYTDLRAYAMSYEGLRSLAARIPDLAMALLEQDCDMISYLFYASGSLAYSSCLTRICDVLWLTDAYERQLDHRVTMTQAFLSSLVGGSSAQVERALRQLREAGVVETGRGSVRILDPAALAALCSDSVRP